MDGKVLSTLIVKFTTITIIMLLLLPPFLSNSQIIYAATQESFDQTITAADGASSVMVESNISRIANEAEFIFTKATHYENGILTYDKKLIEDTYGVNIAPYFVEGVRRLYTEDNLTEHLQVGIVQYKNFVSCMKEAIIGMIPGYDLYLLASSGDFVGFLNDHAWGALAAFIAKKIGKKMLGMTMAGLVTQLGISAGQCLIWG